MQRCSPNLEPHMRVIRTRTRSGEAQESKDKCILFEEAKSWKPWSSGIPGCGRTPERATAQTILGITGTEKKNQEHSEQECVPTGVTDTVNEVPKRLRTTSTSRTFKLERADPRYSKQYQDWEMAKALSREGLDLMDKPSAKKQSTNLQAASVRALLFMNMHQMNSSQEQR